MANTMQQMTAKARGKMETSKAGVQGLKGVFRTLLEEHGEVSALLQRCSEAEPEGRQQLFPTIRKQLLAHEWGELSEVYPLLKVREDTRQVAEDHAQEASEMERLLDELHAGNCASPSWEENLSRLVQLVEHHASEEQERYFPRAQAALGEQTTKELDAHYKRRKAEILQQLG